MRRKATVVAVAAGLVLTATGSYAYADEGTGEQSTSTQAGSAAGDQSRKCIGKKAIRRARVLVTVKRLNRIIGVKGQNWMGTHRLWDVCSSKTDLSAWVLKKRGKLRVFDLEAPKMRPKGRTAPSSVETRPGDNGARRCVTTKTIKRKVRPYMTFRKAKRALGNDFRVTGRNWRTWDACFGDFTLELYRVDGKRRVHAINAADAS